MPISFGDTLSGGVQDISALLPLLGTAQCEKHVESSLQRGFLYAAAAPISIFGSLGLVQAGFSIGLASVPSYYGFGARLLKDAGFEPTGDVAKMITMDKMQYLAETNLKTAFANLHVDDPHTLSVKIKDQDSTTRWNLFLVICSMMASGIILIPYLHFLIVRDTSLLLLAWLFPIIRAMGGSFCVIAGQLLLQRRILTIFRQRMLFMRIHQNVKKNGLDIDLMKINPHERRMWGSLREATSFWKWHAPVETVPIQWRDDITSEECLWDLYCYMRSLPIDRPALKDLADCIPDLPNDNTHAAERLRRHCLAQPIQEMIYQFLIIVGMLGSVVGYIGCFSLVQDDQATAVGRYLWIGLEALLSLVRMMIWVSNPIYDDSPGLEISLQLSKKPSPGLEHVNEAGALTLRLIDEEKFMAEFIAYCGSIPPLGIEFIASFYTRLENHIYIAFLDMKRNQVFLRTPFNDGDGRPFTLYYATMKPKEISITYAPDATVGKDDPIWTRGSLLQEIAIHCDLINAKFNKRSDLKQTLHSITVDWLANPSHPRSSSEDEAWVPIREHMKKVMLNPSASTPEIYSGFQDLYNYHKEAAKWRGNGASAAKCYYNHVKIFFLDHVECVKKAIERQPPGQMIKVYEHECEIFQQGVTDVEGLLFSWASQLHFDSTREYHDSGLDVRSLAFTIWNTKLYDVIAKKDGRKEFKKNCKKLSDARNSKEQAKSGVQGAGVVPPEGPSQHYIQQSRRF